MKLSKKDIQNLVKTDVDQLVSNGSSMDSKIRNAVETRDEMLQALDQVNQEDGYDEQRISWNNSLTSKVQLLDSKIEKMKAEAQERAKRAVPIDEYNSGSSQNNTPNVQIWESISGASKGQKIKVLNNRARLTDVLNVKKGNLTWKDYMRARIAGYAQNHSLTGFDDPGSGFHNVMSTTSDTSMVPEPLSAEIIDRARSKARIFQSGAQTVPMDSKTLTIARISGDPSTAWKSENSSHSASDVSTESLVFTAHTLISSVKMSVELSEDSPNASQVIEDTLSESLALELDRVALVGSGTDPEPQGLFGATNVQTVSMGTNGAALTDYDPFSDAYQKVLEANGTPNAAIFAPRTFGDIDKLKDTTNQPLQPPMSYRELEKYQTTQVPINQSQGTGTGASTAFVGDFSQLLVGVRTDLRIEVSRVASDGTNSAWEDLQVWIRAYLRADVQFAHPDHFCNIIGITS